VLVSIVTPSFQQGEFIERTLASVARQEGVEHIVMDGGSTDGTAAVLRRWRDRIAYTSGPDGGQTEAINTGLARSAGEILAYLNSDDIYYDGAIAAVVQAFRDHPEADVVYGDADIIDADDCVLRSYPTEEWSLERLKLVCFLCQPAVFFRRRVFEQCGPFDARFDHCMDYEYWLRLAMRGRKFVHIPVKLAASRAHARTKTMSVPRRVHTEINDMLKERFGRIPDNWLWNYAHAVLDDRGMARESNRRYATRAALLAVGAALRWNGWPSVSLMRSAASSVVRGSAL